MQDLRGSRKIHPGLMMVSHTSRSEASYQSRAGHGRGAEIRRNLVGGGWLVEFTLNGEPLRAVVVSTDDTAHEVAQGVRGHGPDSVNSRIFFEIRNKSSAFED